MVKTHPDAHGSEKKEPQGIGKSRGGWNTKIHAVPVEGRGMAAFRLFGGNISDAMEGHKRRKEIARFFRLLKGLQGIFTRYDKLARMFSACIYLSGLYLYLFRCVHTS
jgi:hypothetical protein